jgi:hypothetical protein
MIHVIERAWSRDYPHAARKPNWPERSLNRWLYCFVWLSHPHLSPFLDYRVIRMQPALLQLQPQLDCGRASGDSSNSFQEILTNRPGPDHVVILDKENELLIYLTLS